MSEDKFIYVMPVAGGKIVCHFAFLQEVYDARITLNNGVKSGYFSYAPHIVLGSSAGNVAAYIGQASDWNSYAIERNMGLLNSSLFLNKWVSNVSPLLTDIPISFLKGSLYNHGSGSEELFEKFFTSEKIQRSEMWMGTYNIKEKKAQFFCNRNQGTAEISDTFFNEEQTMYESLPLIYTNGNVRINSKVCIASATIPAMVPSQEINGNFYADGGVMYSSPLSVLHKEILRIIVGKERVPISRSFKRELDNNENYEILYPESVEHKEKNMRMFYFYPTQPNGLTFDNKEKGNGIETYLSSILNVKLIQDRNTAIELLNTLSPEGLETETYEKISQADLVNILRFLDTKKHYVVCLYPHLDPKVPIPKINPERLYKAVHHVRNNYGCQIWYSIRSKD